MTRTPAVIFDRDGTLASVSYIAPTTHDNDSWRQYNAAMPFDAPIDHIAALLRSIRPGITRIMTSGRMQGDHSGDRRRLFQMRDWLVKHGLPIDYLFMRRGGDTRVDSVVKADMYRDLIAPYFDVQYVVDDRPQVCDMWRSLGLNVLQVTDPGIMPPIAALASHA